MWEASIEQKLMQPNIAINTQKWPTDKKLKVKSNMLGS